MHCLGYKNHKQRYSSLISNLFVINIPPCLFDFFYIKPSTRCTWSVPKQARCGPFSPKAEYISSQKYTSAEYVGGRASQSDSFRSKPILEWPCTFYSNLLLLMVIPETVLNKSCRIVLFNHLTITVQFILTFIGNLTRERMWHLNDSNILMHSHSETLKLWQWQCVKWLAILLQRF